MPLVHDVVAHAHCPVPRLNGRGVGPSRRCRPALDGVGRKEARPPSVAPGVRIDIWSDVVCPWCYLGKRRFERAVASLGWGGEVEVRMRAYQLDPGASREPGDLRASLERKYGPGAFDAMVTRLVALGAPEGIDYRFDRAQRVNTRDAHRLLAWAWATAPEAQGRLAERLFQAYFEEGADVADHPALARFAADAGLDADAAAATLASTEFGDEVAGDSQAALEREITGVPAFVIEDRLLIPGAQEVDTFVAVLERARQRLAPSPEG
ncbi:MAG: thioredoxin domain-containing protein [Acidimicrobiia bacterium]|nr:thioredoxin domain-containing protein [Acidimicrobiia bacterium]